jgi:hypothetical protein
MLKIGLAYLPVSVIGSVVAITFTQQLLYITDDISKVFQDSIKADTNSFMVTIAKGFGPSGFVAKGSGSAWIMSLFLAMGLLLSTAVMYIILSLREASIYIAALFFPILFAMLIWPSLHKYFKKLVEFLVGMIICKIVMVAAISLMVASFTSLSGQTEQAAIGIALNGDAVNPAQYQQGLGSWFAQCVTMIFTFFIVCFAPNIPSKLFANIGFDDTGRQQATMQNRPDMKRKIDFGNRMVGLAGDAVALKNALGQYGPARRDALETDTYAKESSLRGLSTTPDAYNAEQRARRGYRRTAEGGGPPETAHDYQVALGDRMIEQYSASRQFDERGIAEVLMAIPAENLTSIETNVGIDPHTGGVLPGATRMGYTAVHWTRTDHQGNQVRRVELVMHGHGQNNEHIEVSPAVLRAAMNDITAKAADEDAPIAEIAVHVTRPDQTPGHSFGSRDTARNETNREAQVINSVVKEFNGNGVRAKYVRPDQYGTKMDDDYERLKMYRT